MIQNHLNAIQQEFYELEQKLQNQQELANVTKLDSLADRIREERKKQGLSLQTLSELSGVSYSTITKVEAGEESISLSRLRNIVETLGMKIWIG